MGADTFFSVVRVAHSPARKFTACGPGQVPTAQRICDTGATATDAADGNLTSRITVSPASVPLDKAPGTRMKMVYSVSDYGTPRLNAMVERIIEIISPCASQEFFCIGECLKIPCKQADAIASAPNEEELAGRPPTLHLLDASLPDLESKYGKPITLPLLRGCEAANFANAGIAVYGNVTTVLANTHSKQVDCGVYALAGDGSLVTGVQAAVTQSYCMSSSQCTTCSVSGFEAGLCLPGVYIVEFSVFAPAGGTVTPVQRAVRVAEAAQVEITVQIPYSGTLQQAHGLALSLSGNVDLLKGIVATAETEVRKSLAARASANDISGIEGKVVGIVANQTAGAAPVVTVTVSAMVSFVPGLHEYLNAQPIAYTRSVQQSSSAHRLPDKSFRKGADQTAAGGVLALRTAVSASSRRRLQQGGAVSGLADVLAGMLCFYASF